MHISHNSSKENRKKESIQSFVEKEQQRTRYVCISMVLYVFNIRMCFIMLQNL
jgi:hypothetical protein